MSIFGFLKRKRKDKEENIEPIAAPVIEEGVDYFRPHKPHADSAFDGSPAQSGVASGGIFGANGLLYPAVDQLGAAVGVSLITAGSVRSCKLERFIVSGELPRPFLVFIKSRVCEPIDLPLVFHRCAAAYQLMAQCPFSRRLQLRSQSRLQRS